MAWGKFSLAGESRKFPSSHRQTRVLPLGRGVCETKSKNGRSRHRKPFIARVFCAPRGIETMVPEGARPWGRGRSGDCEAIKTPFFSNASFHGKMVILRERESYFQGIAQKLQFGPPRACPEKYSKMTKRCNFLRSKLLKITKKHYTFFGNLQDRSGVGQTVMFDQFFRDFWGRFLFWLWGAKGPTEPETPKNSK